ncbi:MAG: copper amine oxidase N-terminal domain-containing protein [Selenomonadales bacterium]|nr:copper amine oxidase N-terminal domain-containing protein [Selenomonadales bacterium]
MKHASRLWKCFLMLTLILPLGVIHAGAPEIVVVEASPLMPTIISFEQPTVSVQVHAMPLGTVLTLQTANATAVAGLTGNNRLIGNPFHFWVEQAGARLPELDTKYTLSVMVPSAGVLPSALGLYYYHASEGVWQRVLTDFASDTHTLTGRFTHTGLFALLVDTTPPGRLTSIGVAVNGQNVTLSGMAEALATIQLFVGNQFLGDVQADLRGQYRMQRDFVPGQHVLRLRQLDQAGNVSEQSLALTVTTDWRVHIALVPGSTTATLNRTLLMLEVPPRIVQGRTVVPVRFVAEALGATVTWQEATQSVTVTYGATAVHLTIGSTIATVNGNRVSLDVAPFVERGRTLVPLRFLAETLGFEVLWHGLTNSIEVRK